MPQVYTEGEEEQMTGHAPPRKLGMLERLKRKTKKYSVIYAADDQVRVVGKQVPKVRGQKITPGGVATAVKVVKGRKITDLSIGQQALHTKHFGTTGSHITEMRKHVIQKWTLKILVACLCLLFLFALLQTIFGGLASSSFSGALSVAVGVVLMSCSVIGLLACQRVVKDVELDDDGLESPGQRLLQFYFHISLAVVLLFTPFAVSMIRDPTGLEGNYISKLTKSGDVLQEDFVGFLRSAGTFSVLSSVTMLVSFVPVVEIVTVFEIAQSFLETFAVTVSIVALVLVSELLALMKQSQFLAESDVYGGLDTAIILAAVTLIILVGVSILGFFAAWYENKTLLAIHGCAYAFILIVLFVILIVIVSMDKAEYLRENCFRVVKTMTASWWMDVIECTKYGGTSIGALVEGYDAAELRWYYLVDGVGYAAKCPQDGQFAKAWEVGSVSLKDRTVDMGEF